MPKWPIAAVYINYQITSQNVYIFSDVGVIKVIIHLFIKLLSVQFQLIRRCWTTIYTTRSSHFLNIQWWYERFLFLFYDWHSILYTERYCLLELWSPYTQEYQKKSKFVFCKYFNDTGKCLFSHRPSHFSNNGALNFIS